MTVVYPFYLLITCYPKMIVKVSGLVVIPIYDINNVAKNVIGGLSQFKQIKEEKLKPSLCGLMRSIGGKRAHIKLLGLTT